MMKPQSIDALASVRELKHALQTDPDAPALWLALARALSAQGAPGTAKAWRRAGALQRLKGKDLAYLCRALLQEGRLGEAAVAGARLQAEGPDRAWRKVRALLITAMMERGPPPAARPLLEGLARDEPDQAGIWSLLARVRGAVGDRPGSVAAWLEADRLKPRSGKPSRQMAAVLLQAGALDDLQVLAERHSGEASVQLALGRLLNHEGRLDQAQAALERGLCLDPHNLSALGDLDHVRHARRRGPARLRVVVQGNCQAIGLAQAVRRLLPASDVVHYYDGAPDDPVRIAEDLARADLRLIQPAFAPEGAEVHSLGARTILAPRFVFSGFQPDVFTAATPLRHHSRIVGGAFRLGVPEAQVPDLFNAYVYGVLGYFDAYRIAEKVMIRKDTGLGLDAMLTRWRGQVFVHMPNHPTTRVLHDLAEAACRRAGLPITQTEPGPDWQATGPVWPIYPEIARRLGVPGSLTFREGGLEPPQDLEALIHRAYAGYRAGSAAALSHAQVERILPILKREGL